MSSPGQSLKARSAKPDPGRPPLPPRRLPGQVPAPPKGPLRPPAAPTSVSLIQPHGRGLTQPCEASKSDPTHLPGRSLRTDPSHLPSQPAKGSGSGPAAGQRVRARPQNFLPAKGRAAAPRKGRKEGREKARGRRRTAYPAGGGTMARARPSRHTAYPAGHPARARAAPQTPRGPTPAPPFRGLYKSRRRPAYAQ